MSKLEITFTSSNSVYVDSSTQTQSSYTTTSEGLYLYDDINQYDGVNDMSVRVNNYIIQVGRPNHIYERVSGTIYLPKGVTISAHSTKGHTLNLSLIK